jgi:hypothetical protein
MRFLTRVYHCVYRYSVKPTAEETAEMKRVVEEAKGDLVLVDEDADDNDYEDGKIAALPEPHSVLDPWERPHAKADEVLVVDDDDDDDDDEWVPRPKA